MRCPGRLPPIGREMRAHGIECQAFSSRVAGSKIPGNFSILKFPGRFLSFSLSSLLCLQRGALRRRTGPVFYLVCYGINVRQAFVFRGELGSSSVHNAIFLYDLVDLFSMNDPRISIFSPCMRNTMRWSPTRSFQYPLRVLLRGSPYSCGAVRSLVSMACLILAAVLLSSFGTSSVLTYGWYLSV